jgi:hypothetical protein
MITNAKCVMKQIQLQINIHTIFFSATCLENENAQRFFLFNTRFFMTSSTDFTLQKSLETVPFQSMHAGVERLD